MYAQDVYSADNCRVGSKFVCATEDGSIISGGTASTEELAKRIAVAEAFERSYLDVIRKDNILKKKFLWFEFPSSSGFAAGFDKSSTRFRAICEGLERWAWSQWIDKKCYLPSLEHANMAHCPLAIELLRPFENGLWFKKKFQLILSPKEVLELSFVVFLGCTKDGVFAGSRVSTESDDLFLHPIIEASRNLSNFLIFKKEPFVLKDIIEKRGYYFAENKDIGLKQISAAQNALWNSPEVLLLEEFDTNHSQVFLFRCLLKDFTGWHLGPVERFVY